MVFTDQTPELGRLELRKHWLEKALKVSDQREKKLADWMTEFGVALKGHLPSLDSNLKLQFSFFLLVAFGVLSTSAGQALPAPQMAFLDNGQVRIGMDLALGGAVTFISSKDHPGSLYPIFSDTILQL